MMLIFFDIFVFQFVRIRSRPVKVINAYWYSNMDVARALQFRLKCIRRAEIKIRSEFETTFQQQRVSGARQGPKKINFSREATRNQESGAFLKQSLPARDRAAFVLLLICRRRNETSRGNGESGLRTGEACARYRANNTRRRRASLCISVPRDPRDPTFEHRTSLSMLLQMLSTRTTKRRDS